jgi:hypothetical protein
MSVPRRLPAREVRIPKAVHPRHAQLSQRLIAVELPDNTHGLPSPEDIYEEFFGYTQVLLGHEPSPIESPYLALQEVATAYLARAYELTMRIQHAETSGEVRRNTAYYNIRTKLLRDFIDMTKRLADLGSRRLTQEDLITRQRRDMGEPL